MCSGGIPVRMRSSGGARDREERRAPVQQAQRERLEHRRQQPTHAWAELADVELAVDVVDQRHAGACAATAASGT